MTSTHILADRAGHIPSKVLFRLGDGDVGCRSEHRLVYIFGKYWKEYILELTNRSEIHRQEIV
jgi:hypothetical protein